MVLIDHKLLEWVTFYVERKVAQERGVWNDDSETLLGDVQKLVEDGHMPSGYYKIKKILEERESDI